MKLTKIIVVLGPTASGKTDFALYLAKKINSEIISADSLQVYDKFSICTSKPTLRQLKEIKHHLIGNVPISENYSAFSFVKDAKKKINKVAKENKVPIIVGGTGLYIDALLKNFQFSEFSFERNFNQSMTNPYEMLQKLDPISAQNMNKNDTKRILHAINFFKKFGYSISTQKFKTQSAGIEFQPLKFGLNFKDRNLLYDRINKRVDHMLDEGLLEEINNVRKCKISRTASSAIGYKELIPYFNGEVSLSSAIEKIKQQTRRYAKRQITWFKRCDNVDWIFMDEKVDFGQIMSKVYRLGFNSQY